MGLFDWKISLSIDRKKKDEESIQDESLHNYSEQVDERLEELSTASEMAKEVVENTIVLPVKGDRVSYPDHQSLSEFIRGYTITAPEFQEEYYATLEWLAKYHPDVSNQLENILLANTPIITEFDDSVSDSLAREMIENLQEYRKNWLKYTDSTSAITKRIILQAGIYGAGSVEALVSNDLSFVRKLLFVNPKNIIFQYDKKTSDYIPVQRVPQSSIFRNSEKLINGEYMPLNESTYKYVPLNVIGEVPYGIPPFVAALENILIQKNMITNLKTVIQKLGLLGFMKVMLNKPAIQQGESDKKYAQRLSEELTKNVNEVKKGLANGILAGYENAHEIDMQKITTNVGGAEKLVEMNDTYLLAGLKADPAMMGRNNTTTETFARVILAKMSQQLTGYQELAGSMLSYFDRLHLHLQGYPVRYVLNTFENVMLGDKVKEEEAYGKKIENADKLYNNGIIGQQQRAQMLGYDQPDQEEPRVSSEKDTDEKDTGTKSDDSKKTDPDNNDDSKKKDKSENAAYKAARKKLGSDLIPFNYNTEHNHHDHKGGHVFSFNLTDRERKLWEAYGNEVNGAFQKTTKKVARIVSKAISEFQDGESVESVLSRVNIDVITAWAEDAPKIKPLVNRYVRLLYKEFRSSKTPFGTKKDIPNSAFEVRDFRAMQWTMDHDNLYLGRYITDDDSMRRINRFIRQKYLNDGLPIGKGSEGIQLFRDQFEDVLNLESWKVRRIIDTTVNRMRNSAALYYMEQAEVTEYQIFGITDQLQCPYCRAMQGKTFSIEKEIEKFQTIYQSQPESVVLLNPFVTDSSLELTPETVKKTTTKQLQEMGIGSPPFHPHCRDTVVAVLR